jgi:hypothetical protein
MLSIAYGNWIHGRILEPVVGGFFQWPKVINPIYWGDSRKTIGVN